MKRKKTKKKNHEAEDAIGDTRKKVSNSGAPSFPKTSRSGERKGLQGKRLEGK